MTDTPSQLRVENARAAQLQWARLSVAQRCRSLQSLRQAIAARMDEIVQVISDEIGKPPLDALTGDVLVTLELLRYYERTARCILRPRAVGKPALLYFNARFRESYEPHGVALIFAPWNYPLQLSMVPMATALFAGNAVILKCSERAPQTAALIESICNQADLPANLVQVTCEPPEAAAALIDAQPDIIFFTGSSANGRRVAQHAANYLIPTLLELGGKDACLVFADCDLDRTVEGVTYGAFSNAGQVCVATKRMYVEQSVYASFLDRFIARTNQLRSGIGQGFDIGPLRFDAMRSLLKQQVQDAVQRGAKLHTPIDEDAIGAHPIVLTDVPSDAKLLTDESFGPVVCVAPFQDEADAVRLANASAFALSCSIWTSNPVRARRVADQMFSGSCSVNDVIRNIGNPQAAFGGNRGSGYGRYHGADGLHAFSRKKTIMTALHTRKQEMHWFPLQPRTFSMLRGLLLFRHLKTSLLVRIKHLLRLSALLLLLLSIPASAQSHAQPHLYLDVALPANARGAVAYLVFASKDGFPTDSKKAARGGFVPAPSNAQPSHLRIDTGQLQPGRYAVVLYLDENGNRKLDKNVLGIPREPVGISNNPKGLMGPPHFDKSVFMLNATDLTLSIALDRIN